MKAPYNRNNWCHANCVTPQLYKYRYIEYKVHVELPSAKQGAFLTVGNVFIYIG